MICCYPVSFNIFSELNSCNLYLQIHMADYKLTIMIEKSSHQQAQKTKLKKHRIKYKVKVALI